MNDFLQSLRNGQAEKARTPKTRKNFDNSYYSNTSRFNSYGGSGYPNNRPSQMKRPIPSGIPQVPGNQNPEESNSVLLVEILDNLSTQIDILVKNQEYMITIQERTADLLQRQADAVDIIMDRLNLTPDQGGDIAPTFEHHYVSSQAPDEEIDGTVEDLLRAEMAEEERRRTMAQDDFQGANTNIVKKRRKIVASPPASEPSIGEAADLMPREEIMDIINSMREQGATYDQVAKHLIDLGQPTFSGRGEWHAQTIHRLCSNK
ncbi:hypothetical protein [uncultured Desulfobacter sp.]|uniref:hypothetical protein n=1 Tax=uncultured Desulfobacter sp. TaxID=240139 RepID=UPI002AAC4CC0|nr:hypothetical protein [uncultured Desulfobacter sp.]